LLFPLKCCYLPAYTILHPRRPYFDNMKCS
jgi:hypothetical protein